MALLKELNLDDNTIVFYASDNGPTQEFIKQFHSSGAFRGQKRDLYEGGIRCPMIVRWPGKVAAGATSKFAWSFYDFFPTACELIGAEPPKGLDGISVLPTILGRTQAPHEFLYFEIYEPRFAQAVRMGDWKGIRFGTATPLELYDLSKDIAEKNNLAAQNPDVVKKIEAIINAQHVDTKYWPTIDKPKAGGKKKGAKEATD
jgi:arylsulfatase A-like enzyme